MFVKFLPQDYQRRLDKTVVLHKGYPCELRVVGSDAFELRPINGSSEFKLKVVNSTDPDLDISTPELGYLQVERHAVWCERGGRRNYQQGLSSRNTVFKVLDTSGFIKVNSDHMYTLGFEHMIINRYSPLDESLKRVCEKGSVSIAVSKDIALRRSKDQISVFYKTEEVGWISPKDLKIVHVPKSIDAWIISRYLSELHWEID